MLIKFIVVIIHNVYVYQIIMKYTLSVLFYLSNLSSIKVGWGRQRYAERLSATIKRVT